MFFIVLERLIHLQKDAALEDDVIPSDIEDMRRVARDHLAAKPCACITGSLARHAHDFVRLYDAHDLSVFEQAIVDTGFRIVVMIGKRKRSTRDVGGTNVPLFLKALEESFFDDPIKAVGPLIFEPVGVEAVEHGFPFCYYIVPYERHVVLGDV